MLAIRPAIAVVPGQTREAVIRVGRLEAKAAGVFAPDSQPQEIPMWTFQVREGNTVLGKYAEDLGEHAVRFTPMGSTVDLVIIANHYSTQCASEIFDVRVDVDYVRIESPR